MEIENEIRKNLDDIGFQLSDVGVISIKLSVLMVYGRNPTPEQIKEMVNIQRIEFLREAKLD